MINRKLLYTGITLTALFVLVFLLVNFKVSYNFDVSMFRLINEKMNVPALDSFFSAVAIYGREYFWVPVVALMWILGSAFKNEKAQKGALMLTIVFILTIIIGLTLKQVYYRPRPFLSLANVLVLVPKDFDSSFPSGHALIVAAGASIAFLFLRKKYSIPLVIEAALVCYSRVYVGVHYPTDVLAGIFLGVAISFITYSLLMDTKYFNRLFTFVNNAYTAILRSVHLYKQ
jgi:undecaprenyl-diphosphatase